MANQAPTVLEQALKTTLRMHVAQLRETETCYMLMRSHYMHPSRERSNANA